jgi:hypothetical protein
MKKLIGIICVLAIIAIAGFAFFQSGSAKNFEETVRVKNSNPGDLIGVFKSFQSPEQVIEILKSAGLSWTVLSDSKLSAKDRRPEFTEYSIKISNYADLANEGTLELNFINRRLYKAVFYPSKFDEYIEKLGSKYRVDFRKQKSVKASETILIETGENQTGKYIQWVDGPLENEVTEWIKRFS